MCTLIGFSPSLLCREKETAGDILQVSANHGEVLRSKRHPDIELAIVQQRAIFF
jgi:hypothetical protein